MCQNPSVASFFITLAVPHKTGRKNGLENGETWPKMDFVFLLVLLHVPATSETLLPSKLKSEIWKSQVYWNLCQLIYTSYLLLIFLTYSVGKNLFAKGASHSQQKDFKNEGHLATIQNIFYIPY